MMDLIVKEAQHTKTYCINNWISGYKNSYS